MVNNITCGKCRKKYSYEESNNHKCKIRRWECVYCGTEHNHSIKPIKCSCRSGYVKHIKHDAYEVKDVE